MPCSQQLFRQRKTDYVEGEERTQRKHSRAQTYIPRHTEVPFSCLIFREHVLGIFIISVAEIAASHGN